jgi:hypothetical protein
MGMDCRINKRLWGVVICLALSPLCGSASATEGYKPRGEVGVMFGFLNGMKFDAHPKDPADSTRLVDTDTGLSGGISFDRVLYRSCWLGLTIDLFQVRKDATVSQDITAKAMNASLRLSFHYRPAESQWSFRPGVACGIALVGEFLDFKAGQYLTLRPFFQTVCHLSNRTAFLMEVSMFQTLQGGNDDYDIDAGPAWGFRVGLLK